MMSNVVYLDRCDANEGSVLDTRSLLNHASLNCLRRAFISGFTRKMSLFAVPDSVVWKGIDEQLLKSEVPDRPFRQGQTNYFVKFCCLVNPTSASQRVFVGTPRTKMFQVSPRSSRKVDIQVATNQLGWDIILGPGAEMSFHIELKKPDQITEDVSDTPTIQDWRQSSLNNHRDVLVIYSQFTTIYVKLLAIGGSTQPAVDTFLPQRVQVPEMPPIHWFQDIFSTEKHSQHPKRTDDSPMDTEFSKKQRGAPQNYEELFDDMFEYDIEEEMEASEQEIGKEGSCKLELVEVGENDKDVVEIELKDCLTTVDESIWKLDGPGEKAVPVIVEERAFYDRIISEGKFRNDEKTHEPSCTRKEKRQQHHQQQQDVNDEAASQEIFNMNENVFVIDGLRYDADGKLLE